MLWTILHDLRLLLLRISYKESLSSDCGGGSLASNCQLIYYECLLIHLLDRNTETDDDQMEYSIHAHGLSACLLAATAIVVDTDTLSNRPDPTNSSDHTNTTMDDMDASCDVTRTRSSTSSFGMTLLTRHIADAATMGSLTSIVYHNTHADDTDASLTTAATIRAKLCDDDVGSQIPHPKRQWIVGNDYFLQSLLLCAGRRYALGITGSGCSPSLSNHSSRSNSTCDDGNRTNMTTATTTTTTSSSSTRRTNAHPASSSASTVTLDDLYMAIRPMIIYFAILHQISNDYTPTGLAISSSSSPTTATKDAIELCVERLVQLITNCWKCRTMVELLSTTNIVMDQDTILLWFQKGMMSI
jgi:E3 ubiquitin-protein ligase UBR4